MCRTQICNYPFTTRSIKMGHFFLDGRKHQVTDTPGLLARPDDQRNTMEQLTLAALGCLPTAVLFVIDLTEECGERREGWGPKRGWAQDGRCDGDRQNQGPTSLPAQAQPSLASPARPHYL